MGGLGTIIAFLIGGVLYSLGRITPFVFGSVVMLAAIGAVLLFIREPENPPEDEEKDTKQGFLSNLRGIESLRPVWFGNLVGDFLLVLRLQRFGNLDFLFREIRAED